MGSPNSTESTLTTAPRLSFSQANDDAGFFALNAAWHELWSRVDGHQFQSFGWNWLAWTQVARQGGYQLHIVTGQLNDRLVLVWPLMTRKGTLRMLSSGTMEYRDVLMDSCAWASVWIDQAAAWVRKNLEADTFIFQNLREPSHIAEWARHQKGAVSVGGGWCPTIRLEDFRDWQAYADTLPHSMWKDQRRQWRRLRAARPNLHFQIVTAADEVVAIVEWLVKHKLAWGVSRGNVSVWQARPGVLALLHAVARQALDDGRLIMVKLHDDDEILSAGWGYRFGDEFMFHNFAYDARHQTWSPSRLLLERLLQHCFAVGVRTFDFMPGEEAYKRLWATHFVRTDSFVGGLSSRGRIKLRLLAFLQRLSGLDKALVPIWTRMPPRLRERIRWRLGSWRDINSTLQLKPPPAPQPRDANDVNP